jgi:hypothetical protein
MCPVTTASPNRQRRPQSSSQAHSKCSRCAKADPESGVQVSVVHEWHDYCQAPGVVAPRIPCHIWWDDGIRTHDPLLANHADDGAGWTELGADADRAAWSDLSSPGRVARAWHGEHSITRLVHGERTYGYGQGLPGQRCWRTAPIGDEPTRPPDARAIAAYRGRSELPQSELRSSSTSAIA